MDVVITDLDGTLLDHGTYSFEAALPGLAILRSRSIPLIFCTSKTRREVEYWRERIGNRDPFIVEDGGAVYIPEGRFAFPIPETQRRGAYLVLQLGADYSELVEALNGASSESGCRVRGFHQMTAFELGRICGLTPDMAERAKDREFDEPFLILDPQTEEALTAAIERRGKRCVRGGRFHHVIGDSDKAAAVRRLLDLFRQDNPGLRTIGLGDGLNDSAFLNLVDRPILIRTPWLERLRLAVPRGAPTRSPGPAGWNEAIVELYSGEAATR